MTNTALLDEKIRQSGLKKGFLAEACGLSLAGFRNCCLNKAEFKAEQMQTLWKLLNITTWEERQAIFFAEDGA